MRRRARHKAARPSFSPPRRTENEGRAALFSGFENLEGGPPLFQVETNIDDQNPELFPWLIEKLLQGGAKDAWLTPIVMKKGRAAATLSFLALERDLPELVSMVGRESSTAGLRFFPVERFVFKRRIITVSTPWGEVEVKEICAGDLTRRHPEFESCKKLALEKGVPLREIMSWAANRDGDERNENTR